MIYPSHFQHYNLCSKVVKLYHNIDYTLNSQKKPIPCPCMWAMLFMFWAVLWNWQHHNRTVFIKAHIKHIKLCFLQTWNMFDYIIGVFMILQEELESVTYWNYYGSVEQYKLPFGDVNSPVRKAGLGLLSIRRHKTPCVNYVFFFHLKHMYTFI